MFRSANNWKVVARQGLDVNTFEVTLHRIDRAFNGIEFEFDPDNYVFSASTPAETRACEIYSSSSLVCRLA